MVYVTLTVPKVILTESFISFLGMGVQEPDSSWGTLVSEARGGDGDRALGASSAPAAMLAVTLLCRSISSATGMRDALDPKDR